MIVDDPTGPTAANGSDPRAPRFADVVRGIVDPDIVAVEEALRAAQLSADVDALADLLEDDLLFAGPDGALASKAEDLDAHRSGVVRFLTHEPVDLTARRLDADVVVASAEVRLGVQVGESTDPVTGRFRYTRVWRRTGSRWRVAAGQVAAIVPSR